MSLHLTNAVPAPHAIGWAFASEEDWERGKFQYIAYRLPHGLTWFGGQLIVPSRGRAPSVASGGRSRSGLEGLGLGSASRSGSGSGSGSGSLWLTVDTRDAGAGDDGPPSPTSIYSFCQDNDLDDAYASTTDDGYGNIKSQWLWHFYNADNEPVSLPDSVVMAISQAEFWVLRQGEVNFWREYRRKLAQLDGLPLSEAKRSALEHAHEWIKNNG